MSNLGRPTVLCKSGAVAPVVPAGVIVAFTGTVAPSGWVFCDGSNGTPDLRNRFIVGAGAAYAVGASGGVDSHSVSNHQHTYATHTHSGSGFTLNATTQSTTDYYSTGTGKTLATYTHKHTFTWPGQTTTDSSGLGGSGSVDNRPAFFSLAFIMKA